MCKCAQTSVAIAASERKRGSASAQTLTPQADSSLASSANAQANAQPSAQEQARKHDACELRRERGRVRPHAHTSRMHTHACVRTFLRSASRAHFSLRRAASWPRAQQARCPAETVAVAMRAAALSARSSAAARALAAPEAAAARSYFLQDPMTWQVHERSERERTLPQWVHRLQ
eukprot:6199445-Pleurochrysis_carterae.AAC.3